MAFEEVVIEKDVPPNIRLAIETFIEGAKMMEEYKLDFMPTEYLANLLEALSTHPEHAVFQILYLFHSVGNAVR